MESEVSSNPLSKLQGVSIDAEAAKVYADIAASACAQVRRVASDVMQFEDEPSAFLLLLARAESLS